MFEEYTHLLSDPAHMLVEVTNIIVVDVFILGIVWPFFKRSIRKHDRTVHGEE